MADLIDQLKSWTDAANSPGTTPVSAAEARERASTVAAPTPYSATSRPRRRAFTLVAAAVTLLAFGAVFVSALANDDSSGIAVEPDVASSVPVDPEASRPGGEVAPDLEFRQLARIDSTPQAAGSMQSATSFTELGAIAAANTNGTDLNISAVDFDTVAVVSFTIPDDDCPPTLDAFEYRGGAWNPVFTEPSDACRTPLIVRTYVVAVRWPEGVDTLNFAMTGQPTYGFEDQHITVERPSVGPGADPGPYGHLNSIERRLLGTLVRMGIDEQCCGEPSHGGQDAVTGAVVDGHEISVTARPLSDAERADPMQTSLGVGDSIRKVRNVETSGHSLSFGTTDDGAAVALFRCDDMLVRLTAPGPVQSASSGLDATIEEFSVSLLTTLDCTAPVTRNPPAN